MHIRSKKKIAQIIVGGAIGNLVEWYNFLLYGYLVSIISQLFFPIDNKSLSIALAFTAFALSFFARPFGGILLGWIGDTYGRQPALVISLSMMAVPTFLMACLPTYNSLGILSPILLCIFRIFQGLSAGGEHTGSAVYLAEHAPPQRRALWISTIPSSAALGVLFSSLVAWLMTSSFSQEQLMQGAWRIGFFIGALLCIISIFLRMAIPETPYFKSRKKEKLNARHPISHLFKHFKSLKNLLIVIGLSSSFGIFYQILFIWMPTFLMHAQHLSNSITLQINSINILFFPVLIIAVGYFSENPETRKCLLISSCVAMLVLAYPLFMLLSSGALWEIYLAMAIFTLIFSVYVPTAFVSMVGSFSVKVRYTGLSFGFNIGMAIFGGTCPLVATWLIQTTGNSASPAFYMMLAALLALVVSLPRMPDF